MKNSKGYGFYILWLIGALLLLYYGNRYIDEWVRKVAVMHQPQYRLAASILYSFILGMYLSVLDGFPTRKKFHKPLFMGLFLPSFILLIYAILPYYFKVPEFKVYSGLISGPGLFYLGVLSGVAFIRGLFQSR